MKLKTVEVTEGKLSRKDVAYAINRAIPLTVKFELITKAELAKAFVKLHKDLFQDTRGFDAATEKAGYVSDKAKDELLDIFEELEHEIKSVSKPENLMRAIAVAYRDIFKLHPFNYGNSFLMRKFFVELSHGEVVKKIIPQGIDFRRLTAEDIKAIGDPGAPLEKVIEAFQHSIEVKRNPPPCEGAKLWKQFPDASTTIAGYRFLKTGNNIVTVDGGLVPRMLVKEALESHLAEGGHPYDFKIHDSMYAGYVKGYEGKGEIDGMKVSPGHMTLFCLDIDHLTGLKLKDELPEFLEYIRNKGCGILDVPEHVDEMKHHALVQRAAPRIKAIRTKIYASVDKVFKGKKPLPKGEEPKFFLAMGGTGSGKTRLEERAHKVTKGNYILAALDLSRFESDVYNLYIQLKHHSDDYKSLEKFANAIRDTVIARALEGNYHLFRDGSGIPYGGKGKSEDFMKIIKDSGYETHVLSAAAPLYLEKDRKGDIHVPATERVWQRFIKKKRAVPWDIVLRKHLGHPLAQVQATEDPNVDHMMIFDCMTAKGDTYPLAQTFDVPQELLRDLNVMKSRGSKFLHDILAANGNLLPPIIDKTPKGYEDRVDFMVTLKREGVVRILVTLDPGRMIDIMQKGALNPRAEGYEELPRNVHPWHIPELDYKLDSRGHEMPWRLRHRLAEDSITGLAGKMEV